MKEPDGQRRRAGLARVGWAAGANLTTKPVVGPYPGDAGTVQMQMHVLRGSASNGEVLSGIHG